MKEHNKKKVLKPMIIALAATIGVFGAAISAGAATGLLNFNAIFGRTIRAENSNLSESLLGTATNVTTSCSDEDYVVTLRGVSGTDRSMIANIEISRADGKPVSDCFINPLGETNLHGFVSSYCLNYSQADMQKNYSYDVDENGNIIVTVELSAHSDKNSNQSFSGKQMEINGCDFFPAAAMINYANEHNTSPSSRENLGEGADSVAALLLDWSVDFVYEPSEASLVVKGCENPSEKCAIYSLSEEKSLCSIASISLSATSGEIKGSYVSVRGDFMSEENEVLLIRDDGTTVTAAFNGGMEDAEGFVYDMHYYQDERANKLAVDMTDVTAISINGTVYSLS